jgi:hypothetical protein
MQEPTNSELTNYVKISICHASFFPNINTILSKTKYIYRYSMDKRSNEVAEIFKGELAERGCNVRRNSWTSPENKIGRNLKRQASRMINSKLRRCPHQSHSVTFGRTSSPDRPHVMGIDFNSDEDLD